MRIVSTVFMAASIAVLPCAVRAQGSSEAPIDRAVAAWNKVKTVRGSFIQIVTNTLVGTAATTHGDYAQEGPNRLSIRFSPPAADAIVADGSIVWVYLPSSMPGQVIKRSATARGAAPIDLTGQFLESPHTRYDIRAATGTPHSVDGHSTRAFTLVPKAGIDAPFTTATVWIDDDDSLIREFEETEPSGVVRHIHLTAVQPNVSIDPSVFVFKVPAGVKVVDQTKT